MLLPIQAEPAHIEAICGYLITKPAGATVAEVIDEKTLDRRKLSALKVWGLIQGAGTRLWLSERGLLVARDNGANSVAALRQVVASITPYASVIARAVQNEEMIIQSGEVAAHWHKHFRAYTHFGMLNYSSRLLFQTCRRGRPWTPGRRSQGAPDAVRISRRRRPSIHR